MGFKTTDVEIALTIDEICVLCAQIGGLQRHRRSGLADGGGGDSSRSFIEISTSLHL